MSRCTPDMSENNEHVTVVVSDQFMMPNGGHIPLEELYQMEQRAIAASEDTSQTRDERAAHTDQALRVRDVINQRMRVINEAKLPERRIPRFSQDQKDENDSKQSMRKSGKSSKNFGRTGSRKCTPA